MFKKVTSLFLAICLLLSFVTPALAGYESTPITFDFNEDVTGYGTGLVTQTRSGKTLRVTTDPDKIITVDNYIGDFAVISGPDSNYLDFELNYGELFKLSSFKISNLESTTSIIHIISSKGIIPLTLGADGTSNQTLNWEGITSFRIERQSGEFRVNVDDIVIYPYIDTTPVLENIEDVEATQGYTSSTFSAVVTSPVGADFTYQWFKVDNVQGDNPQAIEGATNALFSTPNFFVGDFYYFCEITNTFDNSKSSTNVAKHTVQESGDFYAWTVSLNNDDDPNVISGVTATMESVNIHAGVKSGYTFVNWTSPQGGDVVIAAPDQANTYFTSSVDPAIIVANWTPTLYPFTIDLDGGDSGMINSNYTAGTTVYLEAGNKAGHTFTGWTSSNGGTFNNAMDPNAEFTMPANATTITATWAPTAVAVSPIITSQPAGGSAFLGDNVSMSVTAADPENGSLEYQWAVKVGVGEFAPIVGATNYILNYTFAGTSGTYEFRCLVTNKVGEDTATTFSEVATYTVGQIAKPDAPSISITSNTGVRVHGGATVVTLTATATPTDTRHTVRYQWFEDGNVIEDATSSTYIVPSTTLPGVYKYTCRVWSYYQYAVDTNSIQVTSNEVSLDIVPRAPTTHAVHPATQTVVQGAAPAPVRCFTEGQSPVGSVITYQWQRQVGGVWSAYGPAGDTLTPDTSTVGEHIYRCTFRATYNGVYSDGVSNNATVTVTSSSSATPVLLNPDDFTTHTKTQGDPVLTISAEATGTSLAYQWYECNSDGSVLNALGSNHSIALNNATVGTRYYKAEVTNVEPDKTPTSITTPLITHIVTAPTYFLTTYGIGDGGTNHLNSVISEGAEVMIYAGVREGFVFSGWTASADVYFANEKLDYTMIRMHDGDLAVTANWKALRTVTIRMSSDDIDPLSLKHAEGDVVNIHAVARPHHSFAGWQADPGVIIADPFSPNTTVTIGSEDIEVTATWALNNSFTVNLAGGNGSTHSSVYPVGYVVSINAGSRSGHTFAGWTSSNGGTFANAANASTTFTMPDNATTITATWTAIPSSGGGGGGGRGNVSTPPANTNGSITASTTAGTTTNSNDVKVETQSGRTEITVAKDFMQKTVDKALDESVKESKDATVTLSVTAPSTSNRVAVGIPVPSIDALAKSSTNASLTVDTPEGSITFNRDALETTAANAEGATVILELARVEKKDLTDSQRDMVGDRPVVDLTLTSNGKQISQLNGKATVSIPYTPASGEDTSKLVVWYLADNGSLTPMECTYENGKVTFTTTHFSVYVVASNKFNDVKINDWYYEAVAKAQEKGLMNGVSSDKFAPQQTTTRAMVTTMLYRMAGKPAATCGTYYTDVDSNAYYADAVCWALDNGVVNGMQEKTFGPDYGITREQLVTMLYRYAGSPSITMVYELDKFSDADTISEYARMAFSWAVQQGIIKGNPNGTLNPKGTATRAEVATIFSNFK